MKSYCLLLFLSLLPTAYGAAVLTPQQQAQNLLKISSQITHSDISDQALKNLGNKIQTFLKDPKHKAILGSPAGAQLRNTQLKLGQYLLTKNKLSRCVRDKKSNLQLSDRVGHAVLNSKACESDLDVISMSKIGDFSQVVKALESENNKSANTSSWKENIRFRSEILQQGFEDALKTYIDLTYRYQPGAKKINVEKVFNELFELQGMNSPNNHIPSRFDSAVKFEIVENNKKYLASLEKLVTPVSLEATRLFLNNKIKAIKAAHSTVPALPASGHLVPAHGFNESINRKVNDKGEIWSTTDETNYQAKLKTHHKAVKNYGFWAGQHLAQTLESPAGTLLFTPSIGEYFTPVFKHKDDETNESSGLRTFIMGADPVKFQPIPTTAVINQSIEEAKDQVKRYGQYLAKMNFTKRYFSDKPMDVSEIKDQLASLARSAPAALAQVIVKHPEYSGLLCEAINLADIKERDKEKRDELYTYGGLIVGGGLMLTGVGSGIGAAVLSGTSTGALLTSVAGSAALLGSAAGIAEIAYLSDRSDKLEKQHNEVRAALFATGSSDVKGWAETKRVMDQLMETNFNLSLTAGFLVLDTVTLASSLRDLSQISKIKALKNAEAFLDNLMKNPKNLAILKELKSVLNDKEIVKLITKMSEDGVDAANPQVVQAYIEKWLTKAMKEDEIARQANEIAPKKVSRKTMNITELMPGQLAYSKLKKLSMRPIDPVEVRMETLAVKKDGWEKIHQSNEVYKITLEDGTKAVWKPHIEALHSSYRSEVLAYEFSKKFGFDLVPPTVERTINGKKGSLQKFIEAGPINDLSYDNEVKQFFFDFVLSQGDRWNGRNYLIDKDGKVVLYDNGYAFNDDAASLAMPWSGSKKNIRLAFETDWGKEVMVKFKKTDLGALKKEMSNYIGDRTAGSCIDRIKDIISLFDESVAKKAAAEAVKKP